MINLRSIGTVLAIFMLAWLGGSVALGQSGVREDLSPCPGSAPEPSQSTAWPIAFCNRTGHDLVIEFHDNDCPAKNGDRRGDVYQRTLRRGESKTLPLCYASEPAGKKPVPGIPTLRIPGGKGVVTTWNVVGDCGDHSKPLSLDARTFYDRGEYQTGIILLQYPSGASHCMADSMGVAGASAPAAASSTREAVPNQPAAAGTARDAASNQALSGSAASALPAQPQAPAAHSAVGASPAGAAAPAAPVNNRGGGAPTLSAAVDTRDVVGRTVRVFAKDGAGYRCTLNVALTFSDGATWNDHAKVTITGGDVDAPIATRKYLKSVSKAAISSSNCTPP